MDTFKDDALYVITTGTGAPLPEKNRVGPQTVVVAGDQILVFDAGPGSTLNLQVSGVDVSSINGLFLTHYHSDHIGDMGELMLKRWASNVATEPLPIYGPVGLDQVVTGFEMAYELDKRYRIDHHGEDMVPEEAFGGDVVEFDLGVDLTTSKVVYSSGDVEVIAFNVDHLPVFPAVGYRVNYKDRSVVIAGDTVYTDSLIDHAGGADLFVCEALHMGFSKMISDASVDMDSNLSDVAHDIQDYHISPKDAAIVAREAGISQLVLTHILPPIPLRILKAGFTKEARAVYDGEIYISNDGTMIKMLVNSDDIRITELLKGR
ncbi:MAG TPA: MBL fold metallo-hydrolase [Bacteroidales bacterium]|nr:MBL fold metallo-hydrolase [Bacteroidales bacterium]